MGEDKHPFFYYYDKPRKMIHNQRLIQILTISIIVGSFGALPPLFLLSLNYLPVVFFLYGAMLFYYINTQKLGHFWFEQYTSLKRSSTFFRVFKTFMATRPAKISAQQETELVHAKESSSSKLKTWWNNLTANDKQFLREIIPIMALIVFVIAYLMAIALMKAQNAR
jgi:hypothetical protein